MRISTTSTPDGSDVWQLVVMLHDDSGDEEDDDDDGGEVDVLLVSLGAAGR